MSAGKPMALLFITVQIVVVVILGFILKNVLDRYLTDAALEQLPSLLSVEGAAEDQLTIVTAKEASSDFQSRVQSLVKSGKLNQHINWMVKPAIWGGVIFVFRNKIKDFSVKSRLPFLLSSQPGSHADNHENI